MPDDRMIPNQSDRAANEANCRAIDELIGDCRYAYIVAWGKFLGFRPFVVKEYVDKAEADNAPLDAIQKFDDGWSTLDDIMNDGNRRQVEALARR